MSYSKVFYTATGSADSFPIPYEYISTADLRVTVNGILKTIGTDYTFPTPSFLKFAVAPVGLVQIQRVTERGKRLVDFQDATILTEADLDTATKQALFIAQESMDTADGAVLVPQQEASITIPSMTQRANTLLGFDGTGQPVAYAQGTLSGFAVSSFALPLLTATSSASACGAIGALPAAVEGWSYSTDGVARLFFSTNDATVLRGAGAYPVVFRNATNTVIGYWTTDGRLTLGAEAGTDGQAPTYGQVKSYVSTVAAPGIFVDAAWTTPPPGLRVFRCNGQAPSLTTYPSLLYIYCGDAKNATASWGYRCDDPANPNTTRNTNGGYIVLPKTSGRFRRDLTDNTGIGNGQTLWMYGTDDVKAHTHTESVTTVGGGSQGTGPNNSLPILTSGTTGSYGGTETTPYFYVCTTWITY
ncbi:phage tail fiber domain-containing protein [Aquabacterium sp.]|uniref:phage tail fiber domain-containing protein n=1 Tax=Aquabacterium sp. TaxID=1872578 RepID=UPI004037B4C9